jgi:hypothetical protein
MIYNQFSSAMLYSRVPAPLLARRSPGSEADSASQEKKDVKRSSIPPAPDTDSDDIFSLLRFLI